MRVLITGGAGYIGSTLARLLLERGDSVHVVDRLTFGIDPLLPLFRQARFCFDAFDISDGEALKRAVQHADALVHLAAVVGAPACKANPHDAQETNVGGTRILNLVRNGHPVVFASTGSVYGALEDACTEATPPQPLTLYGRSKLEAELLLLNAGRVVVYRFATAFGLSPRLRLDLLVNDFTYQAVRNRSLVLYQAGARRTFLHVHDIARALMHALDHFDGLQGQVFNVGGEALNASKIEVARLIQQQVPDFYLHAADIGSDPDGRDYAVDYSKIRAAGFTPQISLEEGIAEMVRAFQHLHLRNRYSNVGGAA